MSADWMWTKPSDEPASYVQAPAKQVEQDAELWRGLVEARIAHTRAVLPDNPVVRYGEEQQKRGLVVLKVHDKIVDGVWTYRLAAVVCREHYGWDEHSALVVYADGTSEWKSIRGADFVVGSARNLIKFRQPHRPRASKRIWRY